MVGYAEVTEEMKAITVMSKEEGMRNRGDISMGCNV